jgi:hypothetical protein
VTPPLGPGPVMQPVLHAAFQQYNSLEAAALSFRNRLFATTLFVLVVDTGLIVLQSVFPEAHIMRVPSDSDGLSAWVVMLLVMLFGGIGALVTAIPAMADVPQVSDAYNFPMQQSFVKIAAGTLSALVGVVAIGNPGLTEGFTSLATLLGTAVIFGAGQQAVTRFLDHRADQIIAAAQ